mmetsp:Transcript_19965/g.67144  ORF Transcript_19965/g.67144 Transcript_19965/m.67144 type:complete len:218 (+) Transcript_19965:582-1235(+)
MAWTRSGSWSAWSCADPGQWPQFQRSRGKASVPCSSLPTVCQRRSVGTPTASSRCSSSFHRLHLEPAPFAWSGVEEPKDGAAPGTGIVAPNRSPRRARSSSSPAMPARTSTARSPAVLASSCALCPSSRTSASMYSTKAVAATACASDAACPRSDSRSRIVGTFSVSCAIWVRLSSVTGPVLVFNLETLFSISEWACFPSSSPTAADTISLSRPTVP